MAGWRTRTSWLQAWSAGAFLGCIVVYGVKAELLSDYFPAGVPGYGTAPGVTVTSRARPDFDPPGLHAGDFLLHPSLEEGFGYDDNVFGSNVARRGSWVIGTHPSLLAGSDWSENSLVGYLGLDDLRYLDQPRQSETNWTASLGGTVSLGRDTLTMAAAHFNLHQPRTDLDALPTDEPVAYQVNDVRIGYTANLGRWSLTPGLAFSTYRYDATTIRGLPASQAYRDRNVLQGSVTARYEVAPERHLLMVLRVLGENFTSPQLGQPTRNSTGYEALAGYGDDSDPVWRYRVLVGWEMRAFQAPQFSTHQAPIAEAALIWSPSGMTTITATLTRSIEDAAQEGIAGYTYSRARVVIDHEYLRNVLLQVSASAQYAQYLPAGGYASSFTLGVGTTWLVNRSMRLSATYDFTDQHGSSSPTLQTTGSYTRSIALVTLRFGI